eukprot:scaffold2765_cov165-Amphora_coffeaeformis.AAC.5
MGWFDGDDSSEDEKQKAATRTAKPDDDDEEDPLDAFMQSLGEQQQQRLTAAADNSKPKACRMDIHQETEESEDQDVSFKVVQRELVPDKEEDNGSPGEDGRASRARQALDAMFRPAGASKKAANDGEEEEEPHNPHDWSRVGVPELPQAATASAYATVRHQFWHPTDTAQGAAWRRQQKVHCTAAIDPILSFDALKSVFTPNLLETTRKYPQPTAVQSQTMPVAMAGRDVLVTAATGQGKTLAYLWPAAVHILDQPHLGDDETGPIALVLVPTRELALQVHKQAKALLQADGGTSKTIIGGQGKYLLFQELKKSGGIEIVVATPGRLLDVLSSSTSKKKNGLTLHRTTLVVLDEADKMLHMGFEAQVRQILRALRPDRQTMLLSATLNRRVEKVAQEWLRKDYVRIAVGQSGKSSEHVDQHVMVLPNTEAKKTFLLQMIPTFQQVGRAIVFCATRDGCESLAQTLREGCPSDVTLDTLHGDKHQSSRTATLRAFTKGDVSILIASDLAGRGLDVPAVATVVNYDPAKNLDTHVHRIGRAGRLSKEGDQQKGTAYTLLTPKDAEFANALRNSFVREDRAVSDELQELADSSRHKGSFTRKAADRTGLGFEHEGTSSAAPPPKRSRWN